jgi:glycosyltransferase involved in cell wall biosynthesis
MTGQPKISVVMPAYNAAETIRRSIESLLRQSLADFEIVIVDDGSRDETVERIGAIGDPRLRLFRQPTNLGGNAARNRGIREARAEIICFLDCDDEFLAHKLEFIHAYFAANPEIDAVIDSFELRYPPEKGGGVAERRNPALKSSEDVRAGIFNRTIFKATPALSVRKAALLKIGLFDETLRRRQDMDLVLRLARQTEIRTISEKLWTKYWTQGAISSKQRTFMPALLDVVDRHPEYLADPRYRRGLARDFARHFARLASKGSIKQLKVDWNDFGKRQHNSSRWALALTGLKEIILRSTKPVD